MRRGLRWVVLGGFLGALNWVGCGPDGGASETVARRASALAPTVSAPFDVESRKDLTPSTQWFPQVACGLTQCLSTFQVFPTVAGFGDVDEAAFVGLRLDRAGNWLESTPIQFPKPDIPGSIGVAPQWVVAQGADFLVGGRALSSEPPVTVYRLKPNGQVEPLGTSEDFGTAPLCVSSDRVVFATSGQVRVYDPTLTPIGTPVTANVAHGILGSTTCLAYAIDSALRIRLSDGVSLDPVPIVPARNLPEWQQSGGYKDGIFLIVSPDQYDLVTFRIRESDGELLDVDDPLAERSGGRLIYANNALISVSSETHAWGDHLFVMWQTRRDGAGLYVGARVDTATGRRVDGSTTTFESELGTTSSSYPLYLTPSGGMMLKEGLAIPLSVQSNPSPVFTLVPASARPLSYQLPNRWRPGVAGSATQYLVGWQRDRSAIAAGSDIEVTRVHPTTGAYLDDPALFIGDGESLSLTSNGTDYLAAWSDAGHIQRRWVRQQGSVEAPLTSAPAVSAVARQTGLAFNGSRFLLVWLTSDRILRAVRLNGAGAVLDSTPFNIASTVESFTVTTNTAPSADQRSFVIHYRDYNFSSWVTTYRALVIRAQSGGALEPEVGVMAHGGSGCLPGSASDGTNIVLSTCGQRGRLDTVPYGGSFIASPHPDSSEVLPAAFLHDGRSYALFEGKANTPSLTLRRFDGSLAPLDTNVAGAGHVVVAAMRSSSFNMLAAGTVGSGNSLVAYSAFDRVRMGMVLKTRLINNDGLPAPGLGGAGGAGGESGASGGGSIAEGGSTGHAGSATDGGAPAQGGASGGDTQGTGGSAGNSQGGTTNGGATNGAATNGGTTNGGSISTEGGAVHTGGSSGGTTVGGVGSEGGHGGNADAGTPSEGGAAGAANGGQSPGGAGGTNGGAGGASDMNGGTGNARSGGATSGGSPGDPDDSGCSCRVAPRPENASAPLLAALGLTLAVVRRRRRAEQQRVS